MNAPKLIISRCLKTSFIAFFLCLGVAAASERDSKHIITQLKATGIGTSYTREKLFAVQTEALFDSVFSCLRRRSADILVCDKTDGLITWCDTSGSFVSLPTDATLIDDQKVGEVAPDRWGNYVYGAALVTARTNQLCLLTIFTLARNSDFDEESYSDGTYEKQLIGSIDRDLYKASIGQVSGNQFAPWQKVPSAISATNYASAFRRHFRNVPSISAELIRQNVQGNPYSVSADRLWSGLLKVISQYDVVIDVNSEKHEAVFARRVSVPDLNQTNATQRADALMVALIDPTSQDACQYRLAVLDKNTLLPTPIAGRTASSNSTNTAPLNETPEFMQAASMVAMQLERHLDTQMFYDERWGTKFLRPGGAPAPAPPR